MAGHVLRGFENAVAGLPLRVGDRGTWTWGCQFAPDGNLGIKACVNTEPFHGTTPTPSRPAA